MKNEKVIDLLSIDADNLRSKQYEALKAHGIDVLTKIIELLRHDRLEDISPMTFYSPAGDDMGCDNSCINFNWTDSDDTDISEFISMLNRLQPKSLKPKVK